MRKQEFLEALAKGMKRHGIPDREKTLDYYREMIEDRMEDGLPEEDAVAAIGTPAEILAPLLAAQGADRQKSEKKPMHLGIILLLALGSPLWISLLAAAFAILLTLFILLWTCVVVAYSVFLSLAAAGVAVIATVPAMLLGGEPAAALLLLGCGLFCAGCAIFAFFGCLAATRGSVYLTRQTVRGAATIFKKGSSL